MKRRVFPFVSTLESLKSGIKLRPISLAMGIILGNLDAINPEQGEGLNKLISQDPSILQYLTFGFLNSALIYVDNKKSRTKEVTNYNIKLCFTNYSLGYGAGFFLTKLFN